MSTPMTHLYNDFQKAYKSTKGFDWENEINELGEHIGKEKYDEKVAAFVKGLYDRSNKAFQKGQIDAWESLEGLLLKIARERKNKELETTLESTRLMKNAERVKELNEIFQNQEIQNILGNVMKQVIQHHNAKKKREGDNRPQDDIMRRGNKELMDQMGQKMSQSVYYGETFFVMSVIKYVEDMMTSVAVSANLYSRDLLEAENPEEGQGGQAPMFLPPPPPKAAPPAPH